MEPLAVSINDTARALGLGRTSIYEMTRVVNRATGFTAMAPPGAIADTPRKTSGGSG